MLQRLLTLLSDFNLSATEGLVIDVLDTKVGEPSGGFLSQGIDKENGELIKCREEMRQEIEG